MDPLDSVPDASDWFPTPVSSLSAIDSALRCQVCKDFYKDPVITSCSHTFCALCARRCLSANGKCPLCWTADEERLLRRNPVVGDLVKAFQAARPDILQLGRVAVEGEKQRRSFEENRRGSGRKRKRSEVQREEEAGAGRVTRSRGQKSPVVEASQTPESELLSDEGDALEYVKQQGTDGNPTEKDDGLAACPICQTRMPEVDVFSHLDTHRDGPTPTLAFKSLPQLQRAPKLPISTTKNVPIPTLAYGLLTETQLRKKLNELKVPSWGSKEIMKQRHVEWRNLVNANCDSSTPRSKQELLRDLKEWEKNKAKSPDVIMEKDFDREAWSTRNESQFKNLIIEARAKRKALHSQGSSSVPDKPDGSGGQDRSLAEPPAVGTEPPHQKNGPHGIKHTPITID